MRIPFLLCGLAALLASCSTPYQRSGIGGGYSDTRLAPDIWRVSFKGNGYTSSDRAQDFALLRVSDLCLANGYTCFAVINEQASESTMAYHTPTTTYQNGTATAYGNQVYYSGTATTTGGSTFLFHFPKSGVLVRGFKEKPEGVFTYDAAFLQSSIREKYFGKGYRPPSK
jgi:hypothetical protein